MVLAVAAATFVLSYAGVHAIALQGGVSVQLARIYPGLFDAVLVIACVAAVVLRDGHWWARCWAWLVVVMVLGAIGATDVLHAMNYALRQRPTEGVVAAAPVVAVLLAFSLLLTMLRQTRSRASDAPPSPRGRAAGQQSTALAVVNQIDATPIDATRIDLVPVDALPVVAAGAVPRPPAPPIALPPAPTREEAALSATAPATPDSASDAADSPVATDSPAVDEQNPPTEPTEPTEAPQPAQATRPAPQAIRYASSAASESAAQYWESEVDPDLAGQVYPVLTSDPDIDTSGYPASEPQDVETDAPPFATAPFASVPRLNRMRVTPIPPTDSDSDSDDVDQG